MKDLIIIIEFADHNLSAYIDGIDGIVATGTDIADIKQKMLEAINAYKETCNELGLEIEEELNSDNVIYKFDIASFLNAYSKILSKSGLEIITGINQKQLWHYASCNRKPRKETIEKISRSIHQFADDLRQIQLS